MALGGAPRGQRGEVVAHDRGPEVLVGGQPGQAAGVLEVESMLETLERLLDAPALMVEFGKGLEGETLGVEMLDQHLAFVAHRLVEREVLEQFEARQEQAEGHGLLDVAHTALGIEQRQAHMRGVAGDQAQAGPASEADLFAHEREQRVIDSLEHIGANLVTRLREGLCSDHSQQPSALRAQSEKTVELGLHCTTNTTEQEREHGGEG